MPVQKITIEQFTEQAPNNLVLDVRSPGEYKHAHIPGAYSLPLFTDEERKVVGTAYKQQSRQAAIKIGLDYFGVKMRKVVEEVELLLKERKLTQGSPIFLHCWRGGMRSAGVAWLLDLYGFKIFTIAGGYKAYRKWVRDQFEKDYPLKVIGGNTGSGKTDILHALTKAGYFVTDLEKLGNHKGSAFGALGEPAQPSQEMFENLLAENLHTIEVQFLTESGLSTKTIYIEDESQRIGQLQIPTPFWNIMRKSPVIFVDIPFEERLDYLTKGYGKFKTGELVNAIIRIQKRLGGLDTKMAIGFLLEGNHKECFSILLKYYDKWYTKGLYNRENIEQQLTKIICSKFDAVAIAALLIQQ